MTDHYKALCTARGYSDISTSDDGKLKTILIQIPDTDYLEEGLIRRLAYK